MPAPEIDILCDADEQGKHKPYICHILSAATKHIGMEGGEISIRLTNDMVMRDLNYIYRKKNKPTNVLSFPNRPPFWGDIIISCERLSDEAAQQKKTFHAHLAHLLIHGLLHLYGYDHEDDGEAEIMEALEIDILHKLAIANPYLTIYERADT